MTQDIFDLVCQISQRTDLYLLYQNLLSGMKVKDERASYLPFFLPQERGREMISFIDLSRLDLRQENDLFDCADCRSKPAEMGNSGAVCRTGAQSRNQRKFSK